MSDLSREAHEASFYDDLSDYADEGERQRYQGRCFDRMCGALDCSNCHPGTASNEAEDEPND